MKTPTKRAQLQRAQFGDFQTPPELAAKVCELAKRYCPEPSCVIEPTCGLGNLLAQAHATFPSARTFIGADINATYLKQAKMALLPKAQPHQNIKLINRSFFDINWASITTQQRGQILVVGNPPWVTSAKLGKMSSTNHPKKSKQKNLQGLDAITGKSNFDISEWICLSLLKSLPVGRSNFALLLKTAVARKLLKIIWDQNLNLAQAQIVQVNARRVFGVSVDACLFLGEIAPTARKTCQVFYRFDQTAPGHNIGYHPPTLITDIQKHERTRHLLCSKPTANWRSGVKHDCAKVLELTIKGNQLVNGFGEILDVESEYVYPLKKSSDVAGEHAQNSRRIIVTQRSTKESPNELKRRAPKLWDYLQHHEALFQARKSSIYRARPPYSIFGIGDYSFAPYKIAISGLYKHLKFQHQGPIDGKPVLYDDTVYFLAFTDQEASKAAHRALSRPIAQDFLNARIFWDAKRPVTATVLRSLCLETLQSLHP